MEKENIFSKLNSKDFNNQLEKILENKQFSRDIKNLLLSMLYKIEVGYKDYTIVKRNVEDKKEYIQEILEIIEQKCKNIVVVEDGTEKNYEMEQLNTKFLVDTLEGNIYLKYPNECLLLYTIYKMNSRQVYLDERYNLIRIALSELLNEGENINNIEVLRDFNGWNWNTQIKEIPDVVTNLIYQNLIYLLNIEKIKEWIHTEKVVDYLNIVKNELTNKYSENYANEILKQIYKIAIIICTSKNIREKQRLLEEKEIIKAEFDRLNNKEKLLEEISNIKKESLKKIKKIDTILSDKKLLEEEYIKRNEKRAEYNKIFSISHLTEILNKERKKMLNVIEENNRLLEPKYYIKTKEELYNQLELLQDIDIKDELKQAKKEEYIITLQKYFIKCLEIELKAIKEKEDIINFFYMLRYYKYIYINNKVQIKDKQELKDQIEELEKKCIKKAYNLKIINHISNNEKTNFEIIKYIFQTKIIKIENINIELIQNDSSLEIKIYDSDVYEKSIIIPNFDKDSILIKFNKLIKIFI